MNSYFIFYVRNQAKSTKFYEHVLDMCPSLNVPGMTEFKLSKLTSFGLMPEDGIKSLLGDKLPDPRKGRTGSRAELYLQVNNPQAFHQRVLESGGSELSPLLARNWGDDVAYSLDLDGHVIAFAKRSEKHV